MNFRRDDKTIGIINFFAPISASFVSPDLCVVETRREKKRAMCFDALSDVTSVMYLWMIASPRSSVSYLPTSSTGSTILQGSNRHLPRLQRNFGLDSMISLVKTTSLEMVNISKGHVCFQSQTMEIVVWIPDPCEEN
jgi:hypothetical protein